MSYGDAGPCLITAIWRCRNPFSQWQRIFQRKLRSHWLKFLRHQAITWANVGFDWWGSLACTREQCHSECQSYCSIYWVWKLRFSNYCRISHGLMSYKPGLYWYDLPSISIFLLQSRHMIASNHRQIKCLFSNYPRLATNKTPVINAFPSNRPTLKCGNRFHVAKAGDRYHKPHSGQVTVPDLTLLKRLTSPNEYTQGQQRPSK